MRTLRLLAALFGGALASALALALPAAPAGASLAFTQTWAVTLNDAGGPIALSSPNVAQLQGGPAVVVGDRTGYLYALSLSNGAAVPGWPFYASGVPIDSTPSVWTPPGSTLQDVAVGVGNAAVSESGGYQAVAPNGSSLWAVAIQNQPCCTFDAGVQASMAVGTLQGTTAVVAGSLGQYTDALGAANGATLNGFPWFQADSNFTTPALADLYGTGRNEIIEGGDSTAGNSYGIPYQNGGHLRILSDTGNAGTGNPSGGLICEYNTDQTVQSSPAVGHFLSGDATGIAFGTGPTYQGAGTTDEVLAVDPSCNLQWAARLDGLTTSSPALADVEGNGALQVVEGTNNGSGGGSVWVLDGANGQALWHSPTTGEVFGSVVTADLTNQGYEDVIVPTTSGVDIFDGRSGSQVATIGTGFGFQNSPLVTDDPNGSIGITVAGYNGNNAGVVIHYELSGSVGRNAAELGSWPMFHHDPQLTGSVESVVHQPGPLFEFVANNTGGRVWNAYDQSLAAGGPEIAGTPSVVADPADGLVHLFAQGASGDLVEYVNDGKTPGSTWSAYDVSAISGGPPIASSPDAFYSVSQGLLHVYTQAQNGDLVEFVNDNAGGRSWNDYDQSSGAGGGGSVAATPDAIQFGTTVHVYVRSTTGDLVEYVNDGVGGHVWNAYDQTVSSGGPPITSAPGAVAIGTIVHVYARASGRGDLVEFVNDGGGGRVWNSYDQTISSGGPPIASDPTPVDINNLVHVYVQGAGSNDLIEFVNDGMWGRVWNAYDQTFSSGGPQVGGDARTVGFGGYLHVYVPAQNGDLMEFVNDGAGGRVWSAYDQTVSSGGPKLGGGPGPLVYGGTVHVYAAAQ